MGKIKSQCIFFVYVWAYVLFFMPAMVRDGIWGSETSLKLGRGGQKTKRREKIKIAD
jgi:hypothetical protein